MSIGTCARSFNDAARTVRPPRAEKRIGLNGTDGGNGHPPLGLPRSGTPRAFAAAASNLRLI